MMENLAWIAGSLMGGAALACCWLSGWHYGRAAGRREAIVRAFGNPPGPWR